MTRCVLGIGSNFKPKKHIKQALTKLEKKFNALTISTIYRSPAEGVKGSDFINLAVLFESNKSLLDLISMVKSIEKKIEHQDLSQKNRKVDLDLLLYGDHIIPKHNIPHQDITTFAFSACPLADILPHDKHPVTFKSYLEICQHSPNRSLLKQVTLD